MASRANWARMSVSSGGTGSITLAAVTNFPTFAKKHGSGSTSVDYVIYDAATGVYEAGTGTYNGTTHVLSSRTVTESYTGGVYGTDAIDVTASAVVFSGLTTQAITTYMEGLLADADDAAGARTELELDQLAVGSADGDLYVWNELSEEWEPLAFVAPVTFGQADPTNGTKVLCDRPGFIGVVVGVSAKTSTGTLSLTVLIDGVAVPNLSGIGVSSGRAYTAATVGAGTAWAADSVLTYTIASESGGADFTASMVYRRLR